MTYDKYAQFKLACFLAENYKFSSLTAINFSVGSLACIKESLKNIESGYTVLRLTQKRLGVQNDGTFDVAIVTDADYETNGKFDILNIAKIT